MEQNINSSDACHEAAVLPRGSNSAASALPREQCCSGKFAFGGTLASMASAISVSL